MRVPHPAQNLAPMMIGNWHEGHFLTFAPMISPPGSLDALPGESIAAALCPFLPFLPFSGAGATLLDFLEPNSPGSLMALSSLGTLPLGELPGPPSRAAASFRMRLASFSAGVRFRRFLSFRFFLALSPSTESSGVSARPR